MEDFNPTPRQRANLARLATYLEALPADYAEFDMGSYQKREGSGSGLPLARRLKAPTCGSSACAIGHGPFAGIRVYGDFSWSAYADRVFGTCDNGSHAGRRMFGLNNKGDHFAAAERIRAELVA